ncbi:ThrRS/AlaRS common domain-containing protein [Paraphaeosphaeria sporulosa]|uniref:ThrRS/AlaRS common domain-containing protein n=1 Tax=Paraphaeosphaeria sporulosa TaxID=1460663 RepID=A0A177CC05_9PLEO|nr:ThrRS/AlaRS common domain-containing protein [Paraphaeosphaeria sporulosa]OAG04298.1 ThrRS/AlaRS common domain-containing protein [Paraphaeosphaeria sporulosa]
MAVDVVQRNIVGALSCQRDSYLRTLETEVISCEEYTQPKDDSKSNGKKSTDASNVPRDKGIAETRTWMIEFADSVLFPEGGGQFADHGLITPLGTEKSGEIPIHNIQRHGLRCVHFSPAPLEVGSRVRQTVDYSRRWDLMQQHTGQHLLSAIMDSMDLPTLGWSMGQPGEMNYVELPRKPTQEEISNIQLRCNAKVRENLPVTVETPKGKQSSSLPKDYDGEEGVIRFIKIGELDYNACCGTHLKQTSHIGLVLLHHTQSIRGTNCRLFFTAGDRAVKLATSSINGLRDIGISLSTSAAPEDVAAKIQNLNDQVSEGRKKEKKMITELAKYQAQQIKESLQNSVGAFLHRPDDGMDFVSRVLIELDDTLKQDRVIMLCTGDVKTTGTIVIQGREDLVSSLSAKVKEIVKAAKGGGKGRKWQGKVTEWGRGEVEGLESAVDKL